MISLRARIDARVYYWCDCTTAMYCVVHVYLSSWRVEGITRWY